MKQLGWGLIGCGDIAQKRVAPAIGDSASGELIAVNRAQSELAAAFAKQFGAARSAARTRAAGSRTPLGLAIRNFPRAISPKDFATEDAEKKQAKGRPGLR